MQSRPVQPATPDFDDVFTDFSPFVWRVLARLGVPTRDLPDVCQEVFVTVYRRLDDFDARAPLRSWIYGIALRTASDYRRKQRVRREQSGDGVPEHHVVPTQDEDFERRRARAYLRATLDELDEEKRAVFILYELEELPMSEIAEALGCPLQTAYSRLHAARKAVALSFRRYPERGGGT